MVSLCYTREWHLICLQGWACFLDSLIESFTVPHRIGILTCFLNLIGNGSPHLSPYWEQKGLWAQSSFARSKVRVGQAGIELSDRACTSDKTNQHMIKLIETSAKTWVISWTFVSACCEIEGPIGQLMKHAQRLVEHNKNSIRTEYIPRANRLSETKLKINRFLSSSWVTKLKTSSPEMYNF